MVLVDTSVWIRALATRAPYADELENLLRRGMVAGHELVYGELLSAHKGDRLKLDSAYEHLIQAGCTPSRRGCVRS